MKTLLLLAALLVSLHAEAGWQRLRDANVDYWLYTPATSEAPLGLMLNLHGCTQTAQDFKDRGNWEEAAEKYHFAVAIPYVPNGGVVMGCWDYYGQDHSPKNHHNGALLGLTEALVKRVAPSPERVYVSGLSSGAGQAMLLGCLRPDLFRGVALAGSPAIGTGMGDIAFPQIGGAEVAEYCRHLAGNRSFAGQKMSLIHGDQDFIVNPQHSNLIVEAMMEIYGLKNPESFDVSVYEGSAARGNGALFRDQAGVARLSLIENTGLGHAWPAGSGYGFAQKYINPQSINYPLYLGAFFSGEQPRR